VKQLYQSFLIGISMYSRIPVPQPEWNAGNMKYSICFFPIVGAVIGALLVGWMFLCRWLGIGLMVFAAVAALLPTLVTGGIHMDGFCDTHDALASCAPTERKLAILKDSNVGAFAVIKTCGYYLVYFAVFTQLSMKTLLLLAVGFVLSRALSGLGVVNFRGAAGSGLAASFREAAHKRTVNAVLSVYAVLCVAAMVLLYPAVGAAAAVCAVAVLVYYRAVAYRQFGGVTGDIAGWFLVLCELWMALGALIAERIVQL